MQGYGFALEAALQTPCYLIMRALRRRGGRVAEGGGLLNRYTVLSRIESSNLFPSANLLENKKNHQASARALLSFRADRQRHAFHRSDRRRMDTAGRQGHAGRRDAVSLPFIRSSMCRPRYRASPDKTSTFVDEWPGRTHEPDDQGSDGQALLLRKRMTTCVNTSPISS